MPRISSEANSSNLYNQMLKGRTTISIDPEIRRMAKEHGLEVSGIAEAAVRAKLGQTEKLEDLGCSHCGKVMEKAYVKDGVIVPGLMLENGFDVSGLKSNWICPGCDDWKIIIQIQKLNSM